MRKSCKFLLGGFLLFVISLTIAISLSKPEASFTNTDGNPRLKLLELTGPATPGQIKEVILKTELPMVPEKLEVLEPVSLRKAENTFWDQSKAYAKATDNSIQPTLEGSLQIAKDFLEENEVDLKQGELSSFISGSTDFSDGKRVIERVTVILGRKINDLSLVDAATTIDIGLDSQIVGYSRYEFELKSIGKYLIISPQEALDLIPKYQHLISGVTLGDTGYITEISLGYWGLRQENIQPVYFIKGYTDQAKKEDTFNLMIPAIKS
jgi:hypothetical protein